MTVPISRFVNVIVDLKNRFPAIEGFGVAGLLQSVTIAGELDADHRTKVYGNIDEVAADFDATDPFYVAANEAFSQNPSPLQIKALWYSATDYTAAEDDAAKTAFIKDELDEIQDQDPNWYWVDIEASLRDGPAAQAVIEWVQARRKFARITSNDENMEDPTDETNIAAVNKESGYTRTGIFYHTDATKYPGFANAAKLGTFNFDEEGSAYTAKFKRVNGLAPIDRKSSVVQAITGFVPGLGRDPASGHLADTYVDTRGISLVVEGGTLDKDTFIDVTHGTDWLAARCEESVFAAMLNNNRIPMDDRGMELLASAVRTVMASADRAGIVAQFYDQDGILQPSYEVIAGDVNAISAAQRAQRVAPAVRVNLRYAGAVHYATVNIEVRF